MDSSRIERGAKWLNSYGYKQTKALKENGLEGNMTDKIVISLYDYTGEALKPWAEAGYHCFAFDIQHPTDICGCTNVEFDSGGSISYVNMLTCTTSTTSHAIYNAIENKDVTFAMAFPVCTDMAVSGAAHFKRKAERDPLFQRKAANYAIWCAELFQALGCPYFIENPVSVLSTLWRKPDYRFHPYDYGGYIQTMNKLSIPSGLNTLHLWMHTQRNLSLDWQQFPYANS